MATEEQGAVIERARAAFADDPNVLAAWIEGSIARGTEDAASDIDLHLAVADEAFQTFGTPADVLARIGRPLGYLEGALPGIRLLPAALAGPVRLDLYLERRSQVASVARHPGREMLFDNDHIEHDIASSPAVVYDPRQQLQQLMHGYWFGAMWPGRFILRGDWGGLFMNATNVVYQFIVPALLIADGSPEFYREQYARSRFLAPHRSEAIRRLLEEAALAFRGIGDDGPDLDAVKVFHAHLMAAIWSAFREACATAGLDYDAAAEAEYRGYYAREFGIEVRAS
jgi:hypothetical protein